MQAGVVGAGTMGTGIAIALADAEISVTISDVCEKALERTRTTIEHRYRKAVERGRISEEVARSRSASITLTQDLNALADAEIIIEAVFEDSALKQKIFARLGAICSVRTILATNTSTLDVDAIVAPARHPERSLGLHFFSPAYVMKLIEIVRAAGTSEQTLAYASAFARRLGKIGVIVGNGDGFVGNRLLLHYRHAAESLLEDGASPRQIDAAMTRFGFAMGPFAVSDMAGLDIAYRAKRERAMRGAAPPFRQSRIPDMLVEMGRLGQKTGAGYYRYDPGDTTAHADPIVEALIARERAFLGKTPRAIDDKEITHRCLLALAQEGARVLREGIAGSAADVDTIWIHGYGFPAAHGGPMAYAQTAGMNLISP